VTAREPVLAFQLGGLLWALPVTDVRELAEVLPLWCVPTLPHSVAGVAQHRGAVLPVLSRGAFLESEGEEDAFGPARQLLLLGREADAPARLGIPVESVLGIEELEPTPADGPGPVRGRARLAGRPVRLLDLDGLERHARAAIGRAAAGGTEA